MDADYDPNRDYKTRKKRGKKYGKKLAEKLPLFDPGKCTLDSGCKLYQGWYFFF